MNDTVNTVLGPVSAEKLGVVSIHESLLSVMPGAQFAFDVTIDRAEVFDILADKLREFREHGGGTIVDSTGMFHGRDVTLYEALSRTTGVHIVASTGQGPEGMLGGYYLTPQTNPPTPWPAEKFAELFGKEVSEGMVVPRVERRAAAGLVTTATTREGRTATDESLVRGAARAALETGVPVSIRYGADALSDLDIVLDEKLPADRILIGGLDRTDAVGLALEIAGRSAYVGIDSVGTEGGGYLSDAERVSLVVELVAAGHAGRILLSSSTTGVAKGHPGRDVAFGHILNSFVPALSAAGVDDATIQRILTDNPRELLTVR
ncbi:phosphotriesterase-related protein [Homoserinimonas aerilata]|uniref:Phosphotriesterase-related protein n=1 Tax=Homoserinimonas aerilata TaxID=1162970 RepID=A0A542YA59_9MICO|nr:phosphotriesterase [Homoserinimonas aerilata]TQL44942.1 phosphotriesterase-related protein [Homoserinimonas aerilata]